MKWPQFRSGRRKATIQALYGTIVAQARSPSFYQEFGVADTVNGRFDMIVLHAALFLWRIEDEEDAVRSLGQGVFDAFCRDMDENLREMGVGDLTVPKEMQRMGEAFYGRAAVYRAALKAGDDTALEDALARNIFEAQVEGQVDGQVERPAGARLLRDYVCGAVARLRAQDAGSIAGGRLDWPPPQNYIASESGLSSGGAG